MRNAAKFKLQAHRCNVLPSTTAGAVLLTDTVSFVVFCVIFLCCSLVLVVLTAESWGLLIGGVFMDAKTAQVRLYSAAPDPCPAWMYDRGLTRLIMMQVL